MAWCDEVESDEYSEMLQAKYIWDGIMDLFSGTFIEEELPLSMRQWIPPALKNMIESGCHHYLSELLDHHNIDYVRPCQCSDQSEKTFLDCMQEQKQKQLGRINYTPMLVLAFEYAGTGFNSVVIAFTIRRCLTML